MNPSINLNSLLTDGRRMILRYENHLVRSGEVSAALSTRPECASLYDEVQHSESTLHAAKLAFEAAAQALSTARSAEEGTRKHLLDLCRSTVTIAEHERYRALKDFLVSDVNDEASIAKRLAHEIHDLPNLGQPLSGALTALRQTLLDKVAALEKASTGLQTASVDFNQAFYRGNSVVAQAKAALAAYGIKLADKKSPKKKKPAGISTEVIAAP